MPPTIDPNAHPGAPTFTWDVNTALAALVLGALVFLAAVKRGFRGVNISV